MKYHYLLRYILFLLVSLLSITAIAQNLRIYPVMDSDPKDFGGWVNCIFQDRFGFIWIDKETGLFRYDGHEIRSFAYNPADANRIGGNFGIRAICHFCLSNYQTLSYPTDMTRNLIHGACWAKRSKRPFHYGQQG